MVSVRFEQPQKSAQLQKDAHVRTAKVFSNNYTLYFVQSPSVQKDWQIA
jgi:hypothetical protein